MDLRLELDEVYKGCEKIQIQGMDSLNNFEMQVLGMVLSLILKRTQQYDNLPCDLIVRCLEPIQNGK